MSNELRIAVPPSGTGFDPEQSGSNGQLHRLCYARLFEHPLVQIASGEWIGKPTQLTGSLAKGVENVPSTNDVRVHLNQGTVSAAGNELTADDVVWSWQRAFALRDVGKWVALIGSVPNADAVVAIDRYTVEFRRSVPNPTLLQQLTRATPAIHDSVEARRHASEPDPWAKAWLSRNPAGFGAYTLSQLTPWHEAVFVANSNAATTPAFSQVRFFFVPGERQRLAMLLDGQADLLPRISARAVQDLRHEPTVHVSRAPSGSHVALIPHCGMPPFDRAEVRQALAYAVPYDRILSDAYSGVGRPWNSMLPTTIPGAIESGWPYHLDLERSRHLLAEAGLAKGFAVDLFVDAAIPEQCSAAELIADSLAGVGIRVTVEPLESSVFWQGGRYHRAYPLCIWDGHDQVPDPYYALVHDYGPRKMGLTNCGSYENPQFTELLPRIEAESRPDDRLTLIAEAQRILVSDCASIPLVQPDFVAAYRTGLEGFGWPPDGLLAVENISWR